MTPGTDAASATATREARSGSTAAPVVARASERGRPRLVLVGVVAAAALLLISPIPLWATSVRDVVGNGFARIIYEASAWSFLVAPWIPIGVVLTALGGLAAAAYWLSGGPSRGRLALLSGWVALSLLGSLVLAAALLPGVLDSYRGPNGFHEMHLRPLYFVGVILALAVLGSGVGALLSPAAPRSAR